MTLAMTPADLPDFIEHMRSRFLQDTLAQATAAFWRRRADEFEAAMPRPGDFNGRASLQDVEARRQRLAREAAACREHAQVMLGGDR